MDREEKTRYILCNQDGKILVLEEKYNQACNKILLPGNLTNYTGSLEFKEKMEKISDSLVHVYTSYDTKKRFQEINGKLKRVNVEVVKNFYVCNVDNEFFYEVCDYFRNYNFECYLMTINEIMEFNETNNTYIDKGTKEAVTILSKKLRYQIY